MESHDINFPAFSDTARGILKEVKQHLFQLIRVALDCLVS